MRGSYIRRLLEIGTTNISTINLISTYHCRPKNSKMVVCAVHLLTGYFCSIISTASVATAKSHEKQGTISTDELASGIQCCYDTFKFVHLCRG